MTPQSVRGRVSPGCSTAAYEDCSLGDCSQEELSSWLSASEMGESIEAAAPSMGVEGPSCILLRDPDLLGVWWGVEVRGRCRVRRWGYE